MSLMGLLRPLLRGAYRRYALASGAALVADLGLFMALLTGGALPVLASAAGYCTGIIIHWLVSTRLVFDHGMATSGVARVQQKGLFVMTALLGLALTTLIVGVGDAIGIAAPVAKIAAIAVSFQATWLARRNWVFRT